VKFEDSLRLYGELKPDTEEETFQRGFISREVSHFVRLLPDVLAYLEKQKLWVFWGHNT